MAAENVTAASPESKPATKTPEIPALVRAKFVFVRAFLWGWASVFSLKGLYLFGAFFGTCEWMINYKRRRRFRHHAKLVFGESIREIPSERLRRACRQQFVRTRCDKLFYLIFDKLPREKILKRVRFHGRDILDKALERNKGAYIAMSHVGSHHVSILLMALLGYKVAGVRDSNEAPLRRYVQQKLEDTFPEARAIRMLFADAYPRDIFRCFEDGFALGSALDVARQRGEHLKTATVNVFGHKREFLTGPVQIALRCGAPVVQGFVISKENFYFHLVIKGPLTDTEAARDKPEIIGDIMQRYADNIAEHLMEHPDHISRT